MKPEITDIHTHSVKPNAICNVTADIYDSSSSFFYSIGIHPWHINNSSIGTIGKIKELATNNNILAIGETGIDHLSEVPVCRQIEIFRELAKIAEAVKKPLIIHNVKGTEEILSVRKELKPEVPWIMHGFRGKPDMAAQILRQDILLSFGERYNIGTLRSVDLGKIFLETDESSMPIDDIYNKIAVDLGVEESRLRLIIANNVSIFFTPQR